MDSILKIDGMYALALTRFFHDQAISVGEASQRPLDASIGAEISELENRQGILITGRKEYVDSLVTLMKKSFFDTIFRRKTGNQLETIELEFPFISKSVLDELRNRVVPTVFNYHRLCIIAPDFVNSIDQTKLSNDSGNREVLGRSLEKKLIWDTYYPGKEIGIEHAKVNGPVIPLSEGKIIQVIAEKKVLILKRGRFKGKATYDGLKTPKRSGDYAVSEVKEGDWSYRHSYFRNDGRFIGEYHNINTPIELYPDKIRYVDLEIDVVRWPDGNVQIIDEGELNRWFLSGYLTEELKNKAKKIAHQLKRDLGAS